MAPWINFADAKRQASYNFSHYFLSYYRVRVQLSRFIIGEFGRGCTLGVEIDGVRVQLGKFRKANLGEAVPLEAK